MCMLIVLGEELSIAYVVCMICRGDNLTYVLDGSAKQRYLRYLGTWLVAFSLPLSMMTSNTKGPRQTSAATELCFSLLIPGRSFTI